MGDQELQFAERWRDNAYGCFSSGHKFCREVCPVMQVTRNENHTPTAFHASIVAMEKGLVESRRRGRRLRPLHPVRRVRAALPEHADDRRLLPPSHADGRRREGDAGADGGDRQRAGGVEALERAAREGPQRAGPGRDPRAPGARRGLGDRARHPDRRRDDPVRRLRGRLLPDLLHARVRAAAAEGRLRVRPDARAVVLRRPGGRDGLRGPGAQARRPTTSRTGARSAPSGSSRPTRTTTSRSPRTIRSTSATTTSSRSCSASSWSTTSSRRAGSS